jgi:exonuclease SbcC
VRPERLYLNNFGPFLGETNIDFDALDDIFLITGKTGSGKTSIFDAICFALYGRVPGSRGDHLTRLRSDYAGDEAECRVALDFSVGEERYRVERSPKRERPNKKKSGLVTEDEKAALYRITPGGLRGLNTKKSEADERIRALIGLDAAEFFRIVLLPQGEFAEFLRQNTSSRQKSLGKLFPVEEAEGVRLLALERAKAASLETSVARQSLEEVSKRITFATRDELRAAAEAALESARKQAQALAEEAGTLRAGLAAREEEREAAARLGELEKAALESEALVPVMAEKEAALTRSRKARPLAELLRREEERRREAEAAGRELEAALAARSAAAEAAENLQRRGGEMAALEDSIRELERKRQVYAGIIAEEEELLRAEAEAASLGSALAKLAGDAEAGRKRLGLLEAEIRSLEEKSRDAEALERRWEGARQINERLVQLKKLAAEAESAGIEEEAAGEKAAALEAECAELERRIPALEEEIRALKAERELGERADMAALLGAGLKPGEPCPVCGSREHPDPAAAHPRLFGIPERIDSLEHAAGDARESLAAKKADLEGFRREARRRAERGAELLASQSELKGEVPEAPEASGDLSPALASFLRDTERLPKPEETARLLEAHVRRLNELTAERAAARRAETRVAELRREEAPAQKFLAEQEKESAALTEKLRHLSAQAAEMRERRGRLLEAEPSGEAPAEPREALAELDRRVTEAGERLRSYREEREEAGKSLAAAEEREAQGRNRREETGKRRLEAETALASALRASPFPGAEELRAALLDEAAEAEAEEALSRYREDAARRESLGAELRRSLGAARQKIAALEAASGRLPPAEEIGARLAALEGERAEAEARRERAGGELAALERDEALLVAAQERYEALSQKSRRLGALADDLSGKNPKKRAFDAWLLGRYLEEVAAYATGRLERMSEGRYSLLLDSAAAGGNAKSGLDLAVFDAYTGKCRPCATLSGGESFMASISLALGLADSIQNRSGGVRLDAVFIDEGFGSLDESTLDLALVILDELREQRMVALISHVGEMRSRIPSRIEVLKSGSGSRIRQNGEGPEV